MDLMHIPPFAGIWFILGIFTLLFLQLLAAFVTTRLTTWRALYKGLPIHKWYGMRLLLRGAKVLMRHKIDGMPTGCFMEEFNGRVWISPNVDEFKLKDLRL